MVRIPAKFIPFDNSRFNKSVEILLSTEAMVLDWNNNEGRAIVIPQAVAQHDKVLTA